MAEAEHSIDVRGIKVRFRRARVPHVGRVVRGCVGSDQAVGYFSAESLQNRTRSVVEIRHEVQT